MARSTKEWFARNKDGTYNHQREVPRNIKLRVKSRANDCCQICGIRVRYNGQVDHIEELKFSTDERPLNRESNLQFLCFNCHQKKTAEFATQRASEAKTQAHLAGFTNKRKPRNYPRKTDRINPRGKWEYYEDRGVLRGRFVYPTTEDNGS